MRGVVWNDLGGGEGYLYGLRRLGKSLGKFVKLGDQVVNKYRSKGTFVISRHM